MERLQAGTVDRPTGSERRKTGWNGEKRGPGRIVAGLHKVYTFLFSQNPIFSLVKSDAIPSYLRGIFANLQVNTIL